MQIPPHGPHTGPGAPIWVQIPTSAPLPPPARAQYSDWPWGRGSHGAQAPEGSPRALGRVRVLTGPTRIEKEILKNDLKIEHRLFWLFGVPLQSTRGPHEPRMGPNKPQYGPTWTHANTTLNSYSAGKRWNMIRSWGNTISSRPQHEFSLCGASFFIGFPKSSLPTPRIEISCP